MENCNFSSWITSVHVSQPSSVVLACKTGHFDQNFKSLWVPALICGFWMPNSEFWPRITSLYWSQTTPALLCNQNGVICTRISSLYWFQPSSVVLCLQNSDFRTRLTSLYGSQTSSVVLSTHNCVLSTSINRLYWFQLSPVVCVCKTACLASE